MCSLFLDVGFCRWVCLCYYYDIRWWMYRILGYGWCIGNVDFKLRFFVKGCVGDWIGCEFKIISVLYDER